MATRRDVPKESGAGSRRPALRRLALLSVLALVANGLILGQREAWADYIPGRESGPTTDCATSTLVPTLNQNPVFSRSSFGTGLKCRTTPMSPSIGVNSNLLPVPFEAQFVDVQTDSQPPCRVPTDVPCIRQGSMSVAVHLGSDAAPAGGAIYSRASVERNYSAASLATNLMTCDKLRNDDQWAGQMGWYFGNDGVFRSHCALDINYKKTTLPYTIIVTVTYQQVNSFTVDCSRGFCTSNLNDYIGPERYQSFAIRTAPSRPKAPTLSVDVRNHTGGPAAFKVGTEADLDLVVSASDDGVGALRGLRFTGAPITVDETLLAPLNGPEPAITQPFELSPGTSVSFRYRFKSLKTGVVSLQSTLRGTDANGDAVEASLDRKISVGFDELAVTASFSDNDFVLEEDATKVTPKVVTVTAKVRNTLTVPIDGVTIDPKPTLKTKSGKPLEPFPVEVTQPALPSSDLGTIAPGETKTVTYKLTAADDVAAVVRLFAIGTIRGGGRADGSVDADFTAKPKYDVYFEAQPEDPKFRGSNPFMFAGDLMAISFKIRNLTTEQKVFVLPILPEMRGTGVVLGGGVPVDLTKFSATEPGAPPFGGELPENTATPQILRTLVKTLPSEPDVKGFINLGYNVRAVRYDDNGDPVPIKAERVLVKDGSGPYSVRIEPPLAYPDTSWSGAFVGFTGSFIIGSIEVVIGLGTGLWWAAQALSTSNLAATSPLFNPSRFVIRQAEATSRFWNSLSDIERQDIIGSVIVAMERQYGEPVTKLRNGLNAGVTDWFVRQDRAVKEGKPVVIAQMAGEAGAEVITGGIGVDAAMLTTAKALTRARLFATEYRQGQIAQRLAQRQLELDARTPQLLSDFRSATLRASGDELAARRVDVARQFETGEVLGTQAVDDIYRVGSAQQSLLKRLANVYDLIITVPASQRAFSGMKHFESLNILPVDAVDTFFLGFRRDDIGKLVLGEGLTSEEIARLVGNVRADFGDEMAEIVGNRARLRRSEVVNKQRALQQFASAGMPLANGDTVRITLTSAPGGSPYGFASTDTVAMVRINSQTTEYIAGRGYRTTSTSMFPAQVATDLVDVRMADGLSIPPALRSALLREILNVRDVTIPSDMLYLLLTKADTALNPAQRSLMFESSSVTSGVATPAAAQFGPDGVVRAVRVMPDASEMTTSGANYLHFVGGLATFEKVVGKARAAVLVKPVPVGPLLQTVPTKAGAKLVSFAVGESPLAGAELTIDPNTPLEETVRVVAPGVASASAVQRAARASASTFDAPDTVIVELAGPLRFDHAAGAFWYQPSEIIRPQDPTASTTTTTPPSTTTTTPSTTTGAPTTTAVPSAPTAPIDGTRGLPPAQLLPTSPPSSVTPSPIPPTVAPVTAGTSTSVLVVVADVAITNGSQVPTASPAAPGAVQAPAYTGSSMGDLTLLAIALLALGSIVLFLVRRRFPRDR